MHVTACLAGQEVDVEVGENCRTVQALREAIVKELPQLCVDGFDVSVGGRALDDDEGVVSLEASTCLDVSANTRGLSVLALREAGHEVSETGLFQAVGDGNVSLCTLYLDAGVPVDCVESDGFTPLHLSCCLGHVKIATLLLDRGSTAIDEKNGNDETPLSCACSNGKLEIATLLLDRGSTTIDEKNDDRTTPLHLSCSRGNLQIATLLLDRGSTAIDEKDWYDETPLHLSCRFEHLEVATLLLDRVAALDEKNHLGDTPLSYACRNENVPLITLLLDRGCSVDLRSYDAGQRSPQVSKLLSERGHDVLPDASP